MIEWGIQVFSLRLPFPRILCVRSKRRFPGLLRCARAPAEVAGLDLGLEGDRWLSLIKQSAEDKEMPKITIPKTLTVKVEV